MMNKLNFAIFILMLSLTQVFALSLDEVFENQKKAAFPDTCELKMRTTVTLLGKNPQIVDVNVINAGDTKSLMTVKSQVMQMQIVQNEGSIKVTDIKTGQTLPAQNIPTRNPNDISKQMGSPKDYNAPVKENGLWKITPKDLAKPTLYYSTKSKRVVKMKFVVNGADVESLFEYCDKTCALPGTLKKVTITTKQNASETSKVVMDVLLAKKRYVLPSGMFEVE